jgi:hypothetical protein
MIYAKTIDGGREWYVYKVTAGDEPGMHYEQYDNSMRSAHFEYGAGESTPNHVGFYYLKNKHHLYADTGWSGVTDIGGFCTAYVNARGYLNGFYVRQANLYSTAGALRTPLGTNNVGRASNWFFTDLGIFSSRYAGEIVSTTRDFFNTDPAGEGFQ